MNLIFKGGVSRLESLDSSEWNLDFLPWYAECLICSCIFTIYSTGDCTQILTWKRNLSTNVSIGTYTDVNQKLRLKNKIWLNAYLLGWNPNPVSPNFCHGLNDLETVLKNRTVFVFALGHEELEEPSNQMAIAIAILDTHQTTRNLY